MATSKAEQIKEQSHFLRGTIQETLRSDASHFGEEDIPLLKFVGRTNRTKGTLAVS